MQQTVRDALETMHKHYQESVAPAVRRSTT